jgi:polysaccharide biosynthesis protein PslH
MRIFYLCRRVPFPPDRGDKIATFNQIRHLSGEHEVHVFCLGDGAGDLENIPGLLRYAKTVTAVPVDPLTIKLRALRALPGGEPLSVAALDERTLHASIRQKFDKLHPDLIIVYSCNVAQFAEHFSDVPRIVEFGDLDSLKWRQYAARSRGPLKWIYAIEEQRLLAYERKIARTFSRAVVHTDVERRDFESLIPGVPVSLVGNGVDLDNFRPRGEPKQPASIVFTGMMDYRPNVDAVEWFCREILPVVQREVPAAKLCHLRQPAGPGSAAPCKTKRRDSDGTGSGHPALPRAGRNFCCAVAHCPRRSEQGSRGAGDGASLCVLYRRLERYGHSAG